MRSNRSVKRWVGDLRVSASLTSWTTRASAESLDLRVTSTSIAPLPLMVPANTREAASTPSGRARAVAGSSTGRLSTGMLSPVTGAWFTLEVPSTRKPSAGIRSLGFTSTTSPTTRSSTAISCTCPSRRTTAVSGASSAKASMARLARPMA